MSAQAQYRYRPEEAPPIPLPAPEPLRDGLYDFDFLHGTWHVRNRRLRARLAGSAEWDEFEGRARERPLLGGQGIIEEYDATLPDGTEINAVGLRLYEPKTRRWTIHWSNAATGTLDAPMIGTFQGGRGVFYGYEDVQGRMVFVRFLWTASGPDDARWEQAFSWDGGTTWETNWIMEFARTARAS